MGQSMRTTTKTILVADDDRTTRTLVAQMLRNEGYRVEQADCGEACLVTSLERNVDGFLVDVKMPGLGGIELCRRLRGVAKYKHTPIIFVTSADEGEKLEEVFAAGADDFISKPVNPVILKARLSGHFERLEYLLEVERVRENMSRYISTRTQRMVEAYAIIGRAPEPEEREVCALFSDVRGFTALSQRLEPNALFVNLSRQLGMQVDTVYHYGGYIDKFAGDGIMAVFDMPERAEMACRCALEIIRCCGPAQADSLEDFQLGIGIHAGTVLIGNIGSEGHLDYSVIGENVNVAARLCASAAPGSILASDAVAEMAGNVDGVEFFGRRALELRGIREPVGAYTVLQKETVAG